MDGYTTGDITICGNFAALLPAKPKDFDYMSTGKWMTKYPWDIREVIGGTVCNCKQVEEHYAPYFGSDFYHNKNCNLMRKIADRPGLMNLWVYDHLPGFAFSDKAAKFDDHIPIYVRSSSRTSHIKVRRSVQRDINQVVLL